MKKLFAAGMMSLFLLGSINLIQANEWGKTPEERQKHLDKKMEKMTKELKLTPEQQSSVRTAKQDKMDRIDAIMRETDQKIRAVLNPSQVQKYNEMMKDEKGKYK